MFMNDLFMNDVGEHVPRDWQCAQVGNDYELKASLVTRLSNNL
jgi:hypothetical protein